MVFNNINCNKFNITDEEFNDLFDDSKYNHLQKSFKKINEVRKVKFRTVDTKKRIVIGNDTASKIFNEQIKQLDNEYGKLSNAEKNEFFSRYNISDLFLGDYDL